MSSGQGSADEPASDSRKDDELIEAAFEQEFGAKPNAPGETVSVDSSSSDRHFFPSIEGYEMGAELHRGGQGIVYQAIQTLTKRKVAIKILLEGPYASKPARRRFEREIDLSARLKHPNIITIFDSGLTPDGLLYCVMDYIRGEPLNRYVKDNKPALDETLKLFASVCDAVQYAHQKGIIHRDLKPSNILVDAEGVPKVLDFGLARPLSDSAQSLVSLTGQVVGTLPYVSPEQAHGNPDEIDVRTDVYSLGVILYELLTGSFPYPVAGHMAEVLRNIAETPPTPPSRIWKPDSGVSRRTSKSTRRSGRCPIDGDIETIVLKSLSKERHRRYQSVGELARDINHRLRGEAIEAKRDSLLYVLKKKAAHHSYATAVLATLALIIISFGAISYHNYLEVQAALDERLRSEQTLEYTNLDLEKFKDSAWDALRMQTLGWFILEWRTDNLARAREIRDATTKGSVEHELMQYLLDETYTIEKLKADLPADAAPLIHYFTGERHLKAGQLDQAMRSFKLSMALTDDDWIKSTAKSRLDHLVSLKAAAASESFTETPK